VLAQGRPELGDWHLYLIECRNGAYYAGITNDIERRFAQHMAGKGAKYTRSNPPVRLLGTRPFADKSAALKAEHAIRKLPRVRKMRFLVGD
jgi:putative endonuclease